MDEGQADVIYIGSQLCADVETPRKYFEGRSDEAEVHWL